MVSSQNNVEKYDKYFPGFLSVCNLEFLVYGAPALAAELPGERNTKTKNIDFATEGLRLMNKEQDLPTTRMLKSEKLHTWAMCGGMMKIRFITSQNGRQDRRQERFRWKK